MATIAGSMLVYIYTQLDKLNMMCQLTKCSTINEIWLHQFKSRNWKNEIVYEALSKSIYKNKLIYLKMLLACVVYRKLVWNGWPFHLTGWLFRGGWMIWSNNTYPYSIKSIDLILKSQNAPLLYHTMLHSEQKCAYFWSAWSIVGYGTCAYILVFVELVYSTRKGLRYMILFICLIV